VVVGVLCCGRSGGQSHGPVESSELCATPSLPCPPNAADLPHSEHGTALGIIVRRQLDDVISRHVSHGQSVSNHCHPVESVWPTDFVYGWSVGLERSVIT